MRADILLNDFIGESFFEPDRGISGRSFRAELDALNLTAGDELVVRVNSPGGSVFDGLEIYNMLLAVRREDVTVTAHVEGAALSAASFIIQAASPGHLLVAKASEVMIHSAAGITFGNAADHRKQAESLDTSDTNIATIYADRSDTKADDWLSVMAAETWYTGPEAVEAGLADGLIAAKEEPKPEAVARSAKWNRAALSRIGEQAPLKAARFGCDRSARVIPFHVDTSPLEAFVSRIEAVAASIPEVNLLDTTTSEPPADSGELTSRIETIEARLHVIAAVCGLTKE